MFRIDATHPDRGSVVEPLSGAVEGSDCRNRYWPGLELVATVLEGDLLLMTGTGRPLAIVKDRPECTLRYVVRPESWRD